MCIVWLTAAMGIQKLGIIRTTLWHHSQICTSGLVSIVLGKASKDLKSATGGLVMLFGYCLTLIHIPRLPQQVALVDLVVGAAFVASSSVLAVVQEKFASKISRDFGGMKTLQCFSYCASTIMLLPLVCIDFIGEALVGADYDYTVLSMWTLLHCIISAIFIMIVPFYVKVYAERKYPNEKNNLPMRVLYLGSSFFTAFWITSANPFDNERYSIILICACASIVAGLLSGYVPSDDSLFQMNDGWLQTGITRLGHDNRATDGVTWRSIIASMHKLSKHIRSSEDSRKIAMFLVLNLAFMFVEVVVGLSTNSLGLLSDAGHMFFDSAALFIGLYASFISKWKPDRRYTYGYARYEILCGFVNGVFLIFIAVFIITESLERLNEPPELTTTGLLATSVVGFIINMIGLVFFHEHAHMEGEQCKHGHSHESNENMHGVFLHILADALGSIGVIISSLLVQFKGWHIADPICSIMISLLILMSSYPLIQHSSKALLLQLSDGSANSFVAALGNICQVDDVVGICNPIMWSYHGSSYVISMEVITSPVGDSHKIKSLIQQVIKDRIANVKHLTVQITSQNTFEKILEHSGKSSLYFDAATGKLTSSPSSLNEKQQEDSIKCHGHSHSHHHSHDSTPCSL